MADDVQGLVVRAQAGDSGAFAELYEKYSPEIGRVLLGHLYMQRDIAEDLTAEVFIKVMQRLGSYQFSGAPFSAWIYRIARNHLIDYVRSRPRHVTSSLDDAAELSEPSAEISINQTLDQHELQAALQHLTGDQRQAITLRFLNGCTTAETAQRMGKTDDAVKKLQARGLVQLRHLIERMRRLDTVASPASATPAVAVGGVWASKVVA